MALHFTPVGRRLQSYQYFAPRPHAPIVEDQSRQHELGLEHRIGVVDESLEGVAKKQRVEVLNPAMDAADGPPGVVLPPSSAAGLGHERRVSAVLCDLEQVAADE
jgi:hypothetical protein